MFNENNRIHQSKHVILAVCVFILHHILIYLNKKNESYMEAEKIYVGIRAEDKSFWERRTPVPPHDCEIIMKKVIIRSIFKSIPNYSS